MFFKQPLIIFCVATAANTANINPAKFFLSKLTALLGIEKVLGWIKAVEKMLSDRFRL